MHPHPKLQPCRQHTPGVPNTGNGPRPTEFRTPPGMKKTGKKRAKKSQKKKSGKKIQSEKKRCGVVVVEW